uniref:Carotenoid oxygenase n=1 Tax=Parastrongyloides trichosuri TaxID=131310 RepID=A0A0N5A412_PARTI
MNIPKFIDGYFLCQLSASYGNQKSPPGQKLTHMIDAIGAVGSFHISNGQVKFSAKYYPSKPYKIWEYYDRNITKSSVPWAGWSDYNVTAMHKWDQVPQNNDATKFHPNLDFWKVGNKIIAGTEAPYWVGYEFDVSKLSNFKQHPFIEDNDMFNGSKANLVPITMAIHERVDRDGVLWGTMSALDFHKQIFYQIIFTVDTEGRRKIVSKYNYGEWDIESCSSLDDEYVGDKADLPGYIHSISSTENYIILPISSLLINPCKFKEPNTEINSDGIRRGGLWGMDFYNMVPARFLVFNKKTLNWTTEKPLEVFPSMFISHQLNAYENKDGHIVADMIVYDNHDPYVKYFYSTFLTKHLYPSTARLLRFILDVNKFKVMYNYLIPQETISADFPQINHDYETLEYEWTYLVEYPFASDNAILKVNVQDPTGSQNTRYRADSSMSLHEPYFISSPDAKTEDDGVLLVRALDLSINKASLLIINATTMKEIGRAHVGINIPFGFHNKFFSKKSLNMQTSSPFSQYNSRTFYKPTQNTINNNSSETQETVHENESTEKVTIATKSCEELETTTINNSKELEIISSTTSKELETTTIIPKENNVKIFSKNKNGTKIVLNKLTDAATLQTLRDRLLKFHKQAGHVKTIPNKLIRTTSQFPPTTSFDDFNTEQKLETPITKSYLFTTKLSTTTMKSTVATVTPSSYTEPTTTQTTPETTTMSTASPIESTTKIDDIPPEIKDKVTIQFYEETLKALCSWIPKVFKTITVERCLESGQSAMKWMTPYKENNYSNQFINLSTNKNLDNSPLAAEIVKRIRAAHITKLQKESHSLKKSKE